MTFCGGGGGGLPPPSPPHFLSAPAPPPQTDIFWEGGSPPPPLIFVSAGPSPQTDIFLGEEGRGSNHKPTKAEARGWEQGDPLMPLLFSIGIQRALEEVAAALLPGEQSCAFLDDVCLLCDPSRVKVV